MEPHKSEYVKFFTKEKQLDSLLPTSNSQNPTTDSFAIEILASTTTDEAMQTSFLNHSERVKVNGKISSDHATGSNQDYDDSSSEGEEIKAFRKQR